MGLADLGGSKGIWVLGSLFRPFSSESLSLSLSLSVLYIYIYVYMYACVFDSIQYMMHLGIVYIFCVFWAGGGVGGGFGA